MSTQIPNLQATQLAARLRRSDTGQVLYNASDEFVEQMVNGNLYILPPDGPGQAPGEKDISEYDGKLSVFDLYGVSAEQAKNMRKARKEGRAVVAEAPNVLVATADAIIAHILRKLENRGVCWLDPNEDTAALVSAAKDRWTGFRRKRANEKIARYRARTEAFFRDPRNAGQPAPSMRDDEAREQLWLDEDRLGQHSRKRFVCRYNCGFQHDDDKLLTLHYRASHPMAQQEADQAGIIASLKEPAPEPEPAKRGRKAA